MLKLKYYWTAEIFFIYTTIKDVKWFFLTLFENIFWTRREKFESNATVTSDANWNLVDGFIGRGGTGASHLDTPLKPHIATTPKLRPFHYYDQYFSFKMFPNSS